MLSCVDLRSLYGDRYRISVDPAAISLAERRDPWMFQIPCRKGTIYPHGGDLLALEIDGHGVTVQQLIRLGLRVHQFGDGECTLLFHVNEFETVAAVVQPHRRPRLTAEQRELRRQQASKLRKKGACSVHQAPLEV